MSDVESLLVVGGGGREFEILRAGLEAGIKTFSSRPEDAVNIGIEGVINTGLGDKDIPGITSWARQEGVDLVVPGAEAPLIAGLADSLRASGVVTYGPGADGAKFEAHKGHTHELVEKYGGALSNPDGSETFTPDKRQAAKDLVTELGAEDAYTKRVGQEGGKGARRWETLEEAYEEIDAVADKGEDLLIQGRLRGEEYSDTFMLDGTGNAYATSLSRDHKSLGEGGEGPNTGGMGAYAPLSQEHASWARRHLLAKIGEEAAAAIAAEGIDYRGTLYAGVMAETKDPDSPLHILEFNVRFGDPEMQVIMASLGGRAIDLMMAAAQGSLESDMSRLFWSAENEDVHLNVVLASPGYSQENAELITGLPIHIPDNLPANAFVHFAGAKMVDGVPVSSGGRVLDIMVRAASIKAARDTAYGLIGRENGGIYIGDDQQVIREDIGLAA